MFRGRSWGTAFSKHFRETCHVIASRLLSSIIDVSWQVHRKNKNLYPSVSAHFCLAFGLFAMILVVVRAASCCLLTTVEQRRYSPNRGHSFVGYSMPTEGLTDCSEHRLARTSLGAFNTPTRDFSFLYSSSQNQKRLSNHAISYCGLLCSNKIKQVITQTPLFSSDLIHVLKSMSTAVNVLEKKHILLVLVHIFL